ncbi:MAG: hypothetical protein WBB29_02900 [Geitlerinemataceae cyanobacterium]
MTEQPVEFSASASPLNYQGIYTCPVCRRGQISAIALMDAFGCNVCHHIFTANLQRQSLRVADTSPALTWRWHGGKWKPSHRDGVELSPSVWLTAGAFVFLPTVIVGTAAYIFPPLPDSPWQWFPLAWMVMAFLSHLAIVAWLILEYYEVPSLMALRRGSSATMFPLRGYRLDR